MEEPAIDGHQGIQARDGVHGLLDGGLPLEVDDLLVLHREVWAVTDEHGPNVRVLVDEIVHQGHGAGAWVSAIGVLGVQFESDVSKALLPLEGGLPEVPIKVS